MTPKEAVTTHGDERAAYTIETQPDPGRKITLLEIADYYFPEGSYPPVDQMYHLFKLLNKLIIHPKGEFYMGIEPLLPFLKDHDIPATTPPFQQPDLCRDLAKSAECALYMQNSSGPRFTFFVDEGDKKFKQSVSDCCYTSAHVLVGLENAREGCPEVLGDIRTEAIPSSAIALNKDRTVAFRILGKDNLIQIKKRDDPQRLIEKSPIIIIEQREDIYSVSSADYYFSIRIAVESEEAVADQCYSPLETLFTIDIKNKNTPLSRDGMINWDEAGLAKWITDGEEPYALISQDQQEALCQPIGVSADMISSLYKRCADVPYDKRVTPDEEKRQRPYYYLELMRLAAKMIYYATYIKNGNDESVQKAISRITQEQFQLEFNRLFYLFNEELGNRGSIKATEYYTPIEYLMYELIQKGVDVWRDFHEFNYLMAKTAERDPCSFWLYMQALGLDKVLPAFQGKTDSDKALLGYDLQYVNLEQSSLNGLEKFCIAFDRSIPEDSKYKRRASEFTLSYWTRIMSPLPDLLPHRDHRPGKEHEQSDEYFLQICFALACYSLELGSEPISSLVVHDGEIITSAHNEPTQYENIYLHAEDLVIERAKEKLPDNLRLADCIIYSSAEPCSECATKIRKHDFSSVRCGIATEMGGETEFNILTSDKLTRQGTPFGRPPKIIIGGILEEEFRRLYRDVMKWKAFVSA